MTKRRMKEQLFKENIKEYIFFNKNLDFDDNTDEYSEILFSIGYLQKNDEYSKKLEEVYFSRSHKSKLLKEIFDKDEFNIIFKMLEYMKVDRQKDEFGNFVSDKDYVESYPLKILNLYCNCFMEQLIIKYLRVYSIKMMFNLESKFHDYNLNFNEIKKDLREIVLNHDIDSDYNLNNCFDFFKKHDYTIDHSITEDNFNKIKKVYDYYMYLTLKKDISSIDFLYQKETQRVTRFYKEIVDNMNENNNIDTN